MVMIVSVAVGRARILRWCYKELRRLSCCQENLLSVQKK
jgi:hypothetical protein